MARPVQTKNTQTDPQASDVEIVKAPTTMKVKLLNNWRPRDADATKVMEPVYSEEDANELIGYKPRPLVGVPEKLNEDGKIKVVAIDEHAKILPGVIVDIPLPDARGLLRAGKAVRPDDLV